MSVISPSTELGAHAVHFYRDDADLAETVGAHLSEALSEGAVVVVIATAPHTRAFERQLGSAGIDVHAAVDGGSLILLDAASTLGELIVEGKIDRDAFQRVVGGLVREAGQDGQPVYAYGEMVDLLWGQGDIADAIELEKLWNELIAEQGFPLLCAYHSEAVAAPEHEHALRDVCRLHTAVTSADEVSREFQPEELAPYAARRLLDDTLRRWGHSGAIVDDARLLISELVANAVIHARSRLSVSIRSHRSTVRLSVRDESSAMPQPRAATPNGVNGGRGLQLVAAMARDWGVEGTADGKVVWAEL